MGLTFGLNLLALVFFFLRKRLFCAELLCRDVFAFFIYHSPCLPKRDLLVGTFYCRRMVYDDPKEGTSHADS